MLWNITQSNVDNITNYLKMNNFQVNANKILNFSLKNYSAEGKNKLICDAK